MKRIFFCIVIAALLSSCFPTRMGYVTSKVAAPKNEFIAPDFIEFLKNKQNISVVLRVPTTALRASATQSDVINDANVYYTLMEKLLMVNGVEVRDRGLLNTLLASGISDYSEIAQKTNADVIVDVSIRIQKADDYTIEVEKTDPYLPAFIPYAKRNIEIEYVVIDFKLIQVNNGKTGLIATRHYVEEKDKFYYVSSINKLGWTKHTAGDYSGLTSSMDSDDLNEIIEEFAEELVSILKAKP